MRDKLFAWKVSCCITGYLVIDALGASHGQDYVASLTIRVASHLYQSLIVIRIIVIRKSIKIDRLVQLTKSDEQCD